VSCLASYPRLSLIYDYLLLATDDFDRLCFDYGLELDEDVGGLEICSQRCD